MLLCLSVCLSVCLSACLSAFWLSVSQSICLPAHAYVHADFVVIGDMHPKLPLVSEAPIVMPGRVYFSFFPSLFYWLCASGMIPLARELIKNGTFVVLAANEVPALNDITAAELKVLLRDCGKTDKLLGRAIDEQIITVVSSGSSLPIIDLTKVQHTLRCMVEDSNTAFADVPLISRVRHTPCLSWTAPMHDQAVPSKTCQAAQPSACTALKSLLHNVSWTM